MMHWSFMLIRRNHDHIYSCAADVGFKNCIWGPAKLVYSIECRLIFRGRRFSFIYNLRYLEVGDVGHHWTVITEVGQTRG
jgi:hypothetical protein